MCSLYSNSGFRSYTLSNQTFGFELLSQGWLEMKAAVNNLPFLVNHMPNIDSLQICHPIQKGH